MTNETVHLMINDSEVEVVKGTTVYHAAKKLGIDIPIFCYLDRLPPFGACRMCLVEVEKMTKPQAACTLEATHGMVVKTESPLALNGRKEMIEFLLINHPLDCPICDRGGECPLQDNTMKWGPGKSRFYEEKRQFKKSISLSPLLLLDRERCITCARCTRFADELAGDQALTFIDRGYATEVGTADGKIAKSKFIGNTIMICPVGALTSQVYRFRARPWDNTSTETTCTLCPVGCSMILDSRDGEIVRTRAKENKECNDIWLCDKGWFGYEFSQHPDRLVTPLIRKNGTLEKSNWENAIGLVADILQEVKKTKKGAGLGGIPLTFEENYLFQALMRKGVGVSHVDYRVGLPVISSEEEEISPGMELAMQDCEKIEFALILGLDITEEFPVIWLRLRQAMHRGAKIIYVGYYTPEIAPYLYKMFLHSPGEELQVLSKVIEQIQREEGERFGAIFVGHQLLANSLRQSVLSQLRQWKKGYPNVSINLMEGKGNSMGAWIAGMHPEYEPYGIKTKDRGFDANQIFDIASKEHWDLLYVVGCNPAVTVPKKKWEAIRKNLRCLIVQDIFLTETAQDADIILPALCYMEKQGTFINIARQSFSIHPGKIIPKYLFSDGEIFKKIGEKIGVSLPNPPDLTMHSYVEKEKMEITIPKNQESAATKFISVFSKPLFNRAVRMKHNKHLSQMATIPPVRIHPEAAEELGISDGNMVSIKGEKGSMLCSLSYDSGIAKKVIVIPLGFPQDIPVQELQAYAMNGLPVEVEKI